MALLVVAVGAIDTSYSGHALTIFQDIHSHGKGYSISLHRHYDHSLYEDELDLDLARGLSLG